MLDQLARILGVSTTITAIMLALVVVQVATQVYALVNLVRREVVLGGRKWVWALVVVLGGLLGAIAYLVAGRPASELDDSNASSAASASGGEAARRAVDVLYNPRDRN
jgi:Phospholipase_D-nuclease N-terminal